MREIDDVEHAEDDGEPEAEQRIERAVDEPDQELPKQDLRADAEHLEHGRSPARRTISFSPAGNRLRRAAGMPRSPGWWRAPCNNPTRPSIPQASSPRTDTSGGS